MKAKKAIRIIADVQKYFLSLLLELFELIFIKKDGIIDSYKMPTND